MHHVHRLLLPTVHFLSLGLELAREGNEYRPKHTKKSHHLPSEEPQIQFLRKYEWEEFHLRVREHCMEHLSLERCQSARCAQIGTEYMARSEILLIPRRIGLGISRIEDYPGDKPVRKVPCNVGKDNWRSFF